MNVRYASVLVLFAAASLAGCNAQNAGNALPQAMQGAPLVPDSGPPACAGQKTTDQYASVTETFSTSGGTICIPAFDGLGGSVKYPPAKPSTSVGLISSTTNYNHKLPSLHSGTPIFYLQLSIAGATTFGNNVKAGGGLTGKSITPGSTYTAYAQAKIDGFPVNFKPCYAVAKKGRYGGVIGGVGSLLKGQSVPAPAAGVIEIYPGQSTSEAC